MPRTTIAAVAALSALAAAASATAQLPTVDPTQPAARETEPVVISGQELADWSARSNTTVRLPLLDLGSSEHNHYAEPNADTQELAPQQGTPVERLLGYRWHPQEDRFVQIPFQVDERFVRYLSNPASGFAFYSGEDQHTTYAFDREGFRYTLSDPDNPCLARPDSPVAVDPVQGLDDNDELAFMAGDAGPAAPGDASLPSNIEAAKRIAIADPSDPSAAPRYVYVMKARAGGPEPEYTAANGYVRYERDANADYFEKSESTYEDYGNAARGVVCDEQGNVVAQDERRRPRDYAWVTTKRYRYRYDGRWLMTQIQISPDGGQTYGPDVVDRWKARAFAQDPGSETPCCGFEEEDTNWGGSSTLLGERVGPVRAIRETWGADSGTNVVRREVFYRDEVRQQSFLRVHAIPPLDGIYAQWDFNAGRMTRFYNPRNPDGVAIDGSNDEVFGNLDDPCNEHYDANDTSDFDQGYRSIYRATHLCEISPYHQSVDPGDPTFADANAGSGWSQTAGPHGTIVDRLSVDVRNVTPGGMAQSVVSVPYYRDDSCFDDGTGTDPGPKLNLRSGDEPREWGDPPQPRECWTPEDGIPDGSERFFQGSIATHGVHLLFLAESDNARLTVPLNEIVADWRMVMLPPVPGEQPNVGERYGRGFEKPLVAVVADAGNPPAEDPGRRRRR
jgi:hypothetical protein